MTKPYELTDEKRTELSRSWLGFGAAQRLTLDGLIRGAEQETRKKLLGYLKLFCSENSHTDIFGRRNIAVIRRYQCPDCMQTLFTEHKEASNE